MRKPFIIAEVAQGYEGNRKLVELYCNVVSDVGADAIKFQVFLADELALPDYKHYKLFKNLEIPFSVWREVVAAAHAKKIKFFSDVFGIASFKKLRDAGADGYKIHTTDITNTLLLQAVGETRSRVFLSTGGCQLHEIEQALRLLKGCDVTLMYGFQAEPTELLDNNLKRIHILTSSFGMPVGFQDHIAGDSPLAFYPAFVALGLGAEVIEKHITLSRMARAEDFVSAFNPCEFARWASHLKAVYGILGKEQWAFTKKELEYRQRVKRALTSVRTIRTNDIIKERDIAPKRTGARDAIYEQQLVVGRKARRLIKPHSVITRKDII